MQAAAGWQKMAPSNHNYFLYLVIVLIVGFTPASSSSYLSYDALSTGNKSPTGRFLLQATKNCPIDLQSKNYTIITSKCKGPNYPPKPCCDALLEFVCGFVDEINDNTNDCAEMMFSYINLYGQYPPGLFANQCKGGEKGLSCDATLDAQMKKAESPKSSSSSSSFLSHHYYQHYFLATLTSFTLFLLLFV